MPGRSYSGEITRAIQQSRAFVLIFSEHSNNSEQVLREVQLAANSRLHIVQFRIDAVTPSDDLEYYLSGPHWLDAVTPPLENHLEQLKSSMKALLALPHAEAGEVAQRPPPPPSPIAPPPPQNISPQAQPPSFLPPASTNIWKWVALAGAAVAAIGCVVVIAAVVIVRSKMPSPLPQTSQSTPAPPIVATSPPETSVAPPSKSETLSKEEAERYVKDFNRDMERGDLQAAAACLDDTIDYYAFGPKDKAFVVEQIRLYFAAVPVRAFVVGDVKVQPGPKPTVATVSFDTRYSVRDALGTPATGRTQTEWDLARRGDALKIVRTNWITYPDAVPSP
jgi:hypothetical protein